ncbi:TPA: hypothetical protein RZK18_001827 [Campylobacter coli]|nr:hypothetical protein [Campylobacter coli]HEB9343255.1 hypothetical protein [Campylobacter coli]
MAFIDKPIVILDIEKFDKENILEDIKFHFKTLAKAYKIFVIDLDANTQIKAGGVEVIIDSNGLVVKGGELKAE